MQTKLSILRGYMAAGNYRAAVKLAASWPSLGDHRDAIRDGWEAYRDPDFQRQIGRDPDELQRAAVAAIKDRYQL